jgi:hypothetical protein
MFPTAILTKLLAPAGRFALSLVLREVFKSEFQLGIGKGPEKLAQAVTNIRAAFVTNEMDIEPEEIKNLVNIVVDILNDFGVFDDVPGLIMPELNQLLAMVFELVNAIADLVD